MPSDPPALLSVTMALRAKKPQRLPATTGRLVHAAFLRALRDSEPGLASELHGEDALKPFTVSPLLGCGRRRGKERYVPADGRCSIRITSMEARLTELLGEWTADPPPTLTFGHATDGRRLAVQHVLPMSGQPQAITYSELAESWTSSSTRAPSSLSLCFETPTTFRTNEANMPLPLPHLVFHNLLSKWCRFAPLVLARGLEAMIAKVRGRGATIARNRSTESSTLGGEFDAGVLVKRFNLETRMLNFGSHGGMQVGFQGGIVYDIGRLEDNERRALELLAEFASFAGVGYRTTWGMGQVRVGADHDCSPGES